MAEGQVKIINEMLQRLPPALWQAPMVGQWLTQQEFSLETVRAFTENNVVGTILLTLSHADIREELGIRDLGIRRRLWQSLEVLRSSAALDDVKVGIQMQKHDLRRPEDQVLPQYVCATHMRELTQLEKVASDHEEAIKQALYFERLNLMEEKDHRTALRISGKLPPEEKKTEEKKTTSKEKKTTPTFTHEQFRVSPSGVQSSSNIMDRKQSRSGMEENAEDLVSPMNTLTLAAADEKSVPVAEQTTECVACMSPVKVTDVRGSCGHVWCKACLRHLLKSAMSDSTLLPIRCCKKALDVGNHLARNLLDKPDLQLFLDRLKEATAKNKMYCPKPTCSKFIDLDELDPTKIDYNFVFACPSCRSLLCYKCKSHSHFPVTCAEAKKKLSDNDELFFQTVSKEKYQQCSKCSHVVELVVGCNHMRCRCDHQFCYDCGAKWKTCTCPTANEARLVLAAEREVPANLQGEDRTRAVRQHVERQWYDIGRHEACYHGTMRRTDEYQYRRRKPKCFECRRRLNIFGYECDDCNRKLCIGCQLNR